MARSRTSTQPAPAPASEPATPATTEQPQQQPATQPVNLRVGTYEVTIYETDEAKRGGRARMGDAVRYTGTLAEVLGFMADDVLAGAREGAEDVNRVTRVTFDVLEGGKGGFFSGRANRAEPAPAE